MKSQWIFHKDQRILFADYTNAGLDASKIADEMKYVIYLASSEPPNTVRTLTYLTGTRGTPEIVDLLKDTAAKMAPYVRKRAVVGLTGLQMRFLDLINKISGNKTFTSFSSLDQAKDWLVED